MGQETITFAPGLPICQLVRTGNRYFAHFDDAEVFIDFVLLTGLGLQRDPVQWGWWTDDPWALEARLIAQKNGRQTKPLIDQLRATLGGSVADAPVSVADPQTSGLGTIGPGWVYVLSNDAHPHLVKIGTARILLRAERSR